MRPESFERSSSAHIREIGAFTPFSALCVLQGTCIYLYVRFCPHLTATEFSKQWKSSLRVFLEWVLIAMASILAVE